VSTVFVANFGGGQVAAAPVQAGGRLLPPSSVQTDTGRGPNPKQNMPHAHGATLDPGGHFVLTPDMGADRIFVYRYDAAAKTLSPGDPPFLQTPPGTGPRHLVFSPDGRFVFAVIELSAEVRAFRWDAKAGRLEPIQTVSLDKPGFTGTPSAAEVVVSHDGRFLYASNRAENSLLVFAIDGGTGRLTQVQDIPSGGDTPRSLGLDPSGRWMLTANENSNTLTVFAIDPRTGALSPAGPPVPVPQKPVAFAFYPPPKPAAR
jgi:6-phosphogluconolactonase